MAVRKCQMPLHLSVSFSLSLSLFSFLFFRRERDSTCLPLGLGPKPISLARRFASGWPPQVSEGENSELAPGELLRSSVSEYLPTGSILPALDCCWAPSCGSGSCLVLVHSKLARKATTTTAGQASLGLFLCGDRSALSTASLCLSLSLSLYLPLSLCLSLSLSLSRSLSLRL